MPVHDLEVLEHAYAPPYGSAMDPINIIGYVASNILKGDFDNFYTSGHLSTPIVYSYVY
jgi:hypothetical protein